MPLQHTSLYHVFMRPWFRVGGEGKPCVYLKLLVLSHQERVETLQYRLLLIGLTIVAVECLNFLGFPCLFLVSLLPLASSLSSFPLCMCVCVSIWYRNAATTISHYFPEHLAHTSKYFLFPSKLLQLKI